MQYDKKYNFHSVSPALVILLAVLLFMQRCDMSDKVESAYDTIATLQNQKENFGELSEWNH